MNSWRILQKICPFILLVLQGVHSDNKADFEKCKSSPLGLPTVKATVYLNGENMNEGVDNASFTTFSTICPWYFPPDVVSLTLKIGANVSCNAKNECTCISSGKKTDCSVAFRNACLSLSVKPDILLTFFCCQTKPDKTSDQCLKETNVNMDEINNCIANKTGQNTAIENSKAMADYKPPLDYIDPYLLFGDPPVYDSCMDDSAAHYWPNTVCAMLKTEVSSKLETCQNL